MTAQEEGVVQVTALLEAARVPYMVIGGLANIVWGEPRATLDIDITVWVDDAQIQPLVDRIRSQLHVLVDSPAAFIAETRVLPAETSSGVRVDLLFGMLPFERAIDRARDVLLAGKRVRVCTPEDLILMKIVSDRERDVADARAIVQRRLRELDRNYLEPRISELSSLLDRPDILARWEEWTRRD